MKDYERVRSNKNIKQSVSEERQIESSNLGNKKGKRKNHECGVRLNDKN